MKSMFLLFLSAFILISGCGKKNDSIREKKEPEKTKPKFSQDIKQPKLIINNLSDAHVVLYNNGQPKDFGPGIDTMTVDDATWQIQSGNSRVNVDESLLSITIDGKSHPVKILQLDDGLVSTKQRYLAGIEIDKSVPGYLHYFNSSGYAFRIETSRSSGNDIRATDILGLVGFNKKDSSSLLIDTTRIYGKITPVPFKFNNNDTVWAVFYTGGLSEIQPLRIFK